MAVDRLIKGKDFTALSCEILASGSSVRFKAHGESMRPFIHSGDYLTIQPIDAPHPPQKYEILLCRLPSGKIVAHRLRSTRPGGLLVQGDACPQPDGWVTPEAILGRVISVEHAGRIFLPTGFLIKIWLLLTPLHPLFFHTYRFLRLGR